MRIFDDLDLPDSRAVLKLPVHYTPITAHSSFTAAALFCLHETAPCVAIDSLQMHEGAQDGNQVCCFFSTAPPFLLRGSCGVCKTLPRSAGLSCCKSLESAVLGRLIIRRSLVRVQPPPPITQCFQLLRCIPRATLIDRRPKLK